MASEGSQAACALNQAADRPVPVADFEAHQGIDLMHEVDSEVSAHVGLKVLPCGMEVAASAATEITAATCSLSAIATAAPAVKRQASGRG